MSPLTLDTTSPVRTAVVRSTALVLGVLFALLASAIPADVSGAEVATLASPPPGSEPSPAPTEALDEQETMLAFAACMRENDVAVDDPRFDAAGNFVGGLDFTKGKEDEGFDVAYEACWDLLVAFKPEADPALRAEQTDAALRFAACMRDEGIDWPDPAPDGSKFAGSDIEIDKSSPAVIAAIDACDQQLSVDAGGAGT